MDRPWKRTVVCVPGVLVATIAIAAGCAASNPVAGDGTVTRKPVESSAPERLSPAYPALRDELLAMMEADMEVREGMCESAMDPEDRERRRKVDGRNTARLKEIIAQYGWPTKSKVGFEASVAAWLVVQHADRDVKFQQECLPLMKAALEQDEVCRKCVAYLIDRVRVNTGRPQLYGTQFLLMDGKNQPRPIEDPEHVDERRKEMGMSTLAEYMQTLQG